MGLKLFKEFSLVFLILAFLLTASFAGRPYKIMNKSAKEVGATFEETSTASSAHHEAATNIHERLLKVDTKDYGRYDPAPALAKPPFKLIPN